MAWAKNGTPYTVSSAEDNMSIADLVPYTFQMFMIHTLTTGSDAVPSARYNNDSGSNYSRRRIHNGGTDVTYTNENYLYWYGSVSSKDIFTIVYNINIAGEEKLQIMNQVIQWTAGASNAPSREEHVGKWVNTSVQISDLDLINVGAGDYETGSNLSALGTD